MVIVVAQVPDRGGELGGLTTKKEFHRALAQVAAQQGQRPAPEPGGNGYGRLKNIAIGELLDDAWIRGQGAEMGIGLRPRQVTRELARLKRLAFKDGAQYRRFLKEARYTRRDVRDRVEVQLFSDRIERRVVARVSGGPGAKQKVFTRFVAEYTARWRSRTVCALGYITDRCSNGSAG